MSSADDYYWKYISGKKFYFTFDNNRIAKKDIDPKLLPNIPFKSNDLVIDELKYEYEALTKQQTKIEKRLNEILEKIQNLKKTPSPEELKARADAAEKAKKREQSKKEKEKRKREKTENANKKYQKQFDDYWNSQENTREAPPSKSIKLPKHEAIEKLKKYDIHTIEDWKNWLKKNHTDKGGDLTTVQLVNSLASDMEWCK
jgi:chemotaxis protein histidine kinase CheA